MNTTAGPPLIGNWYRHLDKGELFRVVGFDEHAHTIEIQVVNGDIDEIDEDLWDMLPIAQAEPPEDSAAAMDNMDSDDASDFDSDSRPSQWSEPLQLERLEERNDDRQEAAESVADNADGAGTIAMSGDGNSASAIVAPGARGSTATSRSWPRRARVRARPKGR